VACCLAAQQRALAGQAWPGGVAVRVRMGPHSCAQVRHQDGYVGMDVHRTARIAAAAHGGQVVLSDATRLPVASGLPAGVLVRDLGLHRLKDLPTPERIYQLVGPGLEEGFPPLKSLGAAPTAFRTALVGRHDEIERLRLAVRLSSSRTPRPGSASLAIARAICGADPGPGGYSRAAEDTTARSLPAPLGDEVLNRRHWPRKITCAFVGRIMAGMAARCAL
jgi:hypothetical protein